MSHIQFIDTKKKKILSSNLLSTNALQTKLTSVASQLGLEIIAHDVLISEAMHERIPTLALDEQNVIVVIEYRTNRMGKLIDKAFVYIDYIKQNISKIKMLLNDVVGVDRTQQVIFDPRLIIIGDGFCKYDESAIRPLPLHIDLVRYGWFEESFLLLEKQFQSKNTDHTHLRLTTKTGLQPLLASISDLFLSLGDDVVEVGIGETIYYRALRTFAYLEVKETIICHVIMKRSIQSIPIQNENDLGKIMKAIEESYVQSE